jgi:hypothetical protein
MEDAEKWISSIEGKSYFWPEYYALRMYWKRGGRAARILNCCVTWGKQQNLLYVAVWYRQRAPDACSVSQGWNRSVLGKERITFSFRSVLYGCDVLMSLNFSRLNCLFWRTEIQEVRRWRRVSPGYLGRKNWILTEIQIVLCTPPRRLIVFWSYGSTDPRRGEMRGLRDPPYPGIYWIRGLELAGY